MKPFCGNRETFLKQFGLTLLANTDVKGVQEASHGFELVALADATPADPPIVRPTLAAGKQR